MKILEYADHVGVQDRTVREWLRKGLLPDAYKDGRGRWWIPADAQRLEIPIAPRVDSAPIREIPPMSSQPYEIERSLRSLPSPGFIPLYMPVDEAAPLLGVTAYQILRHPDEFGVVPWGDNGSYVVPVRRLLGLVSS
jgi:DNA-binding transcriptional MerR regulator